jgi:hypothetical protein
LPMSWWPPKARITEPFGPGPNSAALTRPAPQVSQPRVGAGTHTLLACGLISTLNPQESCAKGQKSCSLGPYGCPTRVCPSCPGSSPGQGRRADTASYGTAAVSIINPFWALTIIAVGRGRAVWAVRLRQPRQPRSRLTPQRTDRPRPGVPSCVDGTPGRTWVNCSLTPAGPLRLSRRRRQRGSLPGPPWTRSNGGRTGGDQLHAGGPSDQHQITAGRPIGT